MNEQRECFKCKAKSPLTYLGEIKFTSGKRKIYACPAHYRLIKNWYEAHA
jgi:hypothetical protein